MGYKENLIIAYMAMGNRTGRNIEIAESQVEIWKTRPIYNLF